MRDFPEAQEPAFLADKFDRFLSALIERHSANNRQLLLEFSGVVNGAVDFEAVAHARLVVLNAMAG